MKKSAKNVLLVAITTTLPLIFGAPVMESGGGQGCGGRGPRVHLTVNSMANESVLNRLELNWAGAAPRDGDWVGLFSADPSVAGTADPLHRVDLSSASGSSASFHVTPVAVNATDSANLGFISKCLDYYVAYVAASGEISAQNCLKLEPTWMEEIPGIGVLPIRDLFLPGTHDSGSYGAYESILGDNIIVKYTVTQDEDMLAQLIRGVRYLDIRIGYYNKFLDLFSNSILCKYPGCSGQRTDNASGFWINHGAFQMHRLEDVVAQIKLFLDNTRKEVIIFDVQEFPYGFNTDNVHHALVNFLYDEFYNYIIPRGAKEWNSRVSDLWRTGKMIVSYDNNAMVSFYPWLWKRVEHKWGNVRTPQSLFSYLASVNSNPPADSWSAMAELTPSTWDVITDELGGLRQMADSVNRNVSAWYRGAWGAAANVVAVDFFRGTDVVATAIEWNKRKAAAATGGRFGVDCATDKWRQQRAATRPYQFFQFKFL